MNDEIITKKAKKYNRQDKRLENRAISIYQILLDFQSNPEIMRSLAECSYPHLEDGLALQQAVQATLSNRQGAVAEQIGATLSVRAADQSARTAYKDFRKMAQVAFKQDAARTALGLSGRVLTDRARFIRQARASFEAALTPDYAPALARRGCPESVIRDGLARLDALVAADAAQLAAKAAAQQATADRQAAMRCVDDWFIEFRDTAKIALRDHLEWLPLLKIR